MKIFVFSKKKIYFCSIILFIALIVSSIYVEGYSVVKSNNNIAYNEFDSKIREIYNREEKVAYLTFDDGPTSTITPKVLDILKSENVKATFFVIGKSVENNPEIVKRAYEEGHYIANHGYSHNNKVLYRNEESFKNEIKKTDDAIGKAINVEDYCSHIFRFPHGFMSLSYKSKKKGMLSVLSEMEYTYIDWNCLNNDSMKKYTKEQLVENLKKSSKDKNTLVVLMHDTKDVSNSSEALKDSIDYLKSEGYTFENFYSLIEKTNRKS